MTVLIAGAGIGGLTLGLSLHQVGVPFRIYESVARLRPLGVGINLQPHAVRELHALGLAAQLDRLGLRTEQVAYFSAQGGAIWAEPRGKLAGYNWPQYSIHRGDLQMLLFDTLRARAGPECIQCGAAVGDWSDTAQGVRVALTGRDGSALPHQVGGVLVAADGINSRARARLNPTGPN